MRTRCHQVKKTAVLVPVILPMVMALIPGRVYRFNLASASVVYIDNSSGHYDPAGNCYHHYPTAASPRRCGRCSLFRPASRPWLLVSFVGTYRLSVAKGGVRQRCS